jgi:hypothetical protein
LTQHQQVTQIRKSPIHLNLICLRRSTHEIAVPAQRSPCCDPRSSVLSRAKDAPHDQAGCVGNEELMRFYAPQVARATTTAATTETAEMSVAVGPSMAQELVDIFSTLNMALRDVLTSEEE